MDGSDGGAHRRGEAAAPADGGAKDGARFSLLVLGLGVAFVPGGVPGLVEPGEGGAGMEMR